MSPLPRGFGHSQPLPGYHGSSECGASFERVGEPQEAGWQKCLSLQCLSQEGACHQDACWGRPGGVVVKDLPANAGDMG